MPSTVAKPINEIITTGSFNSISTKFITYSNKSLCEATIINNNQVLLIDVDHVKHYLW
mgnify:CR=1 FL=1